MRLRFTPSAREQFLTGLDFIRRDKPAAARRFRRKAEQSLRKLLEDPDSGRKIPESPGLPFREIIVSPYRFFYKVKGKTIWIVAVWHGAQRTNQPL